jgi:general transcription factor 3C polypeptide 1
MYDRKLLCVGWKDGWCLMCDVLLRLPLSVFVKMVNISIEIPGLERYLAHPILQV